MDKLDDTYFRKYCDLLYKNTGIFISNHKKETFKLKLFKAMRKLNISSHDQYLQYLQDSNSKEYFQQFVNYMTTNTTEFFREKQHFDFIEKNLSFILQNNPRIMQKKEIRIWSAACSSGQESVSLAILMNQCMAADINIKILATDIDSEILSVAVRGVYPYADCEGISEKNLLKYFNKVNDGLCVNEEIRNMIKYRLFNLMNDFKFKKGFDIIFCRNVMIYFNTLVQERLVNKFYEQLVPGGLLFIGHSESLANKSHDYKYIEPAIYMK